MVAIGALHNYILKAVQLVLDQLWGVGTTEHK